MENAQITKITGLSLLYYFLMIVSIVGHCVAWSYPQTVNPLPVLEEILWEHGMDDVAYYRIPIISYTPKGNLVAAVEARKYSSADAGPKFLAVRRSTNGGTDWSPQQFILNDGTIVDGVSLGMIIVDDVMASIFIFYGMCDHYDQCHYASLHYIKSMDDGVTWQKSVNVSEQIGTSKMMAPGPGYGIQKKYAPNIGRLIVCAHSTLSGDGMFTLLSDDHGKTWKQGGSVKSIPYNMPKKAGDFDPNECQPIEMPDGSILVNLRNQEHYHCRCRVIARSYDGGNTFPIEYVTFDTALNDSAVAAGLLYHNGVMFFSNPNSATQRTDLTLKWSYDNGTTWTGQLQIWPKASSYSSMTILPGGLQSHIFLIYEKGVASALESVSLVKISLYGGL